MPRHDVAIYSPDAASFYERGPVETSGGAQRQTVLLARTLAAHGLRTAHIVNPVADPVATDATLVIRPEAAEHGTLRAFLLEARRVWSALDAADASVVVLRGAQGGLGVAALWARVRRRSLVFAAANDSDFGDGSFEGARDLRARMFRFGLNGATAIVVQTADQLELARAASPRVAPVQINSFVEPMPAADGPAEQFLWVSRLADYKRPLLYADLAAALPEARFAMIPTASGDPGADELAEELRTRAATLDNLELLPQRSHAELQELIGSAVAVVNTSSFEGMPNTWLEGWARGIPALTFSFDPDRRIASNGLGAAAEGDWDRFVAAARQLWDGREDRDALRDRTRAFVATAHGDDVTQAWLRVVRGAGD